MSRLHLSSKSLPGVLKERNVLDGARDSVREVKISLELYRMFHQDPTLGSLSRLHLSSKSLPGVLEDMEGPDGAGVGVGGSSIPIGTFPQSLMTIQARDL